MDEILAPLNKDLKCFETDGVRFVRPENSYIVHDILNYVSADNLGAHTLAGMLESFSAKQSCRFCMLNKEELQNTFYEIQSKIRTENSYHKQCEMIKLDKNLSQIYGLKNRCPLSELQNFKVTKGFPSDIAHDLLEGFASNILEDVILHCINLQIFTLKELNELIKSWPYAPCDVSEKPSPVSEEVNNFKLKQTASQTSCLLRIFPLWFGNRVSANDKYWNVLILLLRIIEIAFSPVVSKSDIYYIEWLIEDLLTDYADLVAIQRIKPKAHYMTHYGSQMRNFGPLRCAFTLRFESVHGYFKELIARTKNRKNLCKSLAKQYQEKQGYLHSEDNYIYEKNIFLGSTLESICLLHKEI